MADTFSQICSKKMKLLVKLWCDVMTCPWSWLSWLILLICWWCDIEYEPFGDNGDLQTAALALVRSAMWCEKGHWQAQLGQPHSK